MSKVSNCIRMIGILKARGLVKVGTLAELLEVDKRHIMNYKNDLEKAGIYIESKSGIYGGYYLPEKTFLDNLKLTDLELSAILRAKDSVVTNGGFLYAAELETAASKIALTTGNVNNLKEQSKIYISKKQDSPEGIQGKYAVINQAINQRKKIRIIYKSLKGETTERIIHPYELFNYSGSWYCIVFCEMQKGMRDLKITRIISLEMLKEPFVVPDDFNLNQYIGSSSIFNDEHTIKIKLEAPQSIIVSESIWDKDQKIEWLDERTMIFQAKMQGRVEIINWILGMGEYAEVIEPEYIKEEIKGILEKMMEKYGSGGDDSDRGGEKGERGKKREKE